MKILLPTDFSENSLKSIDYAIFIFGDKEVQYHLLHTFEIISTRTSVGIGELKSEMEKQADEHLVKLANELIKKHPQIKLSLEYKYGALSDLIHQNQKEDYDFIVMGTKGSSGLKEVFLGSNTWDVIANTNIPVLSVPQMVDFKQDIKLLFAIDPYNLPSKKVIEILLKMEEYTSFDINILVIKNNGDFKLNEINELFKGIRFNLIMAENEDVEEAIEIYQQKKHIDLLVMVNQKRSFWENLFHNSITKKLTFHSKSPLLTIKD
jgi:nucleotide-binding universal stress UspA family protein